MTRVSGLKGMRHLALNVKDVERSRVFYQEFLGMDVVWQPDETNVYLSSGPDNLALHQEAAPTDSGPGGQQLDHMGFIVDTIERVEELEADFRVRGVPIVKPFKRHRDGSASFYCADPDGVVIQMLYEPALSKQTFTDS